MRHAYSESYLLADGNVSVDIDDNCIYVTLSSPEEGICIDASATELFHLSALFTRAYGRATSPELIVAGSK